ncbi:MAG: ParB N-terminal domain-containing protein [Parvularculaceae bacterium]|nr:ParB N-terminal domain-containing protein [Parvularculaceae bacterium]
MAKPKPKTKSLATLSLSASREIPLDKLVLSQSNVRQIKAGVSIEELAEDIARRTLLQGLTVRAVLDETGAETGIYDVPAGGRRLRALQLLVSQKRLASDAPIPCVIRTDGLAEEDSLAENIQRAPLHPLDQFRAFKTLREKGKSEEEIAAAFFVSPTIVKQRLKLAAVSPQLLDLYADDGLTLEQLMAFTVNPDHQRQVEVWAALRNGYNREPYHIRRMLTEGAVRAGDKRARFIGIDAYERAGGAVLRDLFADADDFWLQDAGLLNRLVAEKLEANAAEIRDEGWKWVEAAVGLPYGHTFDLRRIEGETAVLSDDQQQAYDAAKAEHEALEDQYDGAEELPEDIDQRLGELEAIIETIDERPFDYPPEEVARAGVFISLDQAGGLRVERGFVRSEDEPPVDVEAPMGADTPSNASDAHDDEDCISESPVYDEEAEDDGATRPLPDRLMVELTEWRTLALRDAMAANPDVAFLAALHALCLDLFYAPVAARCVSITARQTPLRSGASGLADGVAAQSIAARNAALGDKLPGRPEDLWASLTAMSAAERQALFAHCVGLSIDAVYKPYDRRSDALVHADALGNSLALDVRAAGWTPTAEGYFARITKAQIVDAVRESKGEDAANRLEGLKKPDMAAAAEELLAPSEWLPAVLRTRAAAEASDEEHGDSEVVSMSNEPVAANEVPDGMPAAGIAAE